MSLTCASAFWPLQEAELAMLEEESERRRLLLSMMASSSSGSVTADAPEAT